MKGNYMDNIQQIEEIKKYYRYLNRTVGRKIDLEFAAQVWIRKYARLWRMKHLPMRIAS
jgi:hypothetical protein